MIIICKIISCNIILWWHFFLLFLSLSRIIIPHIHNAHKYEISDDNSGAAAEYCKKNETLMAIVMGATWTTKLSIKNLTDNFFVLRDRMLVTILAFLMNIWGIYLFFLFLPPSHHCIHYLTTTSRNAID